jgi:hypothetical protein
MSFDVERIEDAHELLKAVSRAQVHDDFPEPGVFVPLGAGISTSWSKHSTPQQCREIRSRPHTNHVFALPVGRVRSLSFTVTHTPKDWCRAHADISEVERDPEYQVKLARLAAEAGIRLRADPPKSNKR